MGLARYYFFSRLKVATKILATSVTRFVLTQETSEIVLNARPPLSEEPVLAVTSEAASAKLLQTEHPPRGAVRAKRAPLFKILGKL